MPEKAICAPEFEGAVFEVSVKEPKARHPWRTFSLEKADRELNSKRGGHEPRTDRPFSKEKAKDSLRRIAKPFGFHPFKGMPICPKCEISGPSVYQSYEPAKIGWVTWCSCCGAKNLGVEYKPKRQWYKIDEDGNVIPR